MAILALENLKVEYGGGRVPVRAVDRGDFALPEGQVVGLVGESGCGKTTLARAITGVMARNARITGGRIVFEGTPADLKANAKVREEWLEV